MTGGECHCDEDSSPEGGRRHRTVSRNRHALIVSAAQADVVEPGARTLVRALGVTITDIFVVLKSNALIVGNGIWFERIARGETVWPTLRSSSRPAKEGRLITRPASVKHRQAPRSEFQQRRRRSRQAYHRWNPRPIWLVKRESWERRDPSI